MSTAMAVSGSAVAAPAINFSSVAALGSSGVQQLGAVRSPASFNASRIVVAVRASHNPEELQTPVKSKVLVALVAAGAAFALDTAPASPAYAGFFGGDVKVERVTRTPDFPRNEGTGTKVGDNSDVRGSANSGTLLGEAADGANLVGDNQSTRQSSVTGTPLGEGSSHVEGAPAVVEKIGELNPSIGGLGDASSVANDAKNAAQNLAGEYMKSRISGTNTDDLIEKAKELASNISGFDGAEDAKSAAGGIAQQAAQNLAGDAAKSKSSDTNSLIESAKELVGNVSSFDGAKEARNAAGNIAKNAARDAATNAARDFAQNSKDKIDLSSAVEAGKSLLNKVAN